MPDVIGDYLVRLGPLPSHVKSTTLRACDDATAYLASLTAEHGGDARLRAAAAAAREQVEAFKRRIEEASQYVDIEQLCLSPQCGFSSTVEGNALTYDQEVAKLRLIVETAEEVWG